MDLNFPKPSSSPNAAPAIVKRAKDRVLEIFNRHADGRLVFHNFSFAAALAEQTAEIANGEGLDARDAETARLAAWFLPVGYAIDYANPLRNSLQEAERFLLQEACPDAQRQSVLQCLRLVMEQQPPTTPAAHVLWDASQVSASISRFRERQHFLKLEWEFFLDRRLSDIEWARLQLQQLLGIRLYTPCARTCYEDKLANLILKQKEELEDMEDDKPGPEPRRFQGLEKRRYPVRATQSFLRTNYNNHIHLSAIADNKANIMISVNSILISVLITILTYRNLNETQPMVLLPGVVFLVTGLCSLIFAVLSARPKVTMLNRKLTDKNIIRRNIVFFGNFVHLNLDEYEEAMDAVYRNDELLYGNLTRDLYYLGKVLDKKYRYLSISYNIFMAGFIATVVSFLFLLLR